MSAFLQAVLKAGFDPSQPRNERGRWVDDGGTVTTKIKAGDGVAHKIMVGGVMVGHISGFEKPDARKQPDGSYKHVTEFEVYKTELSDVTMRGTGLYHKALQEVADQYDGGLYTRDWWSSKALQVSISRMPTFVRDGDKLRVLPRISKYDPDQPRAPAGTSEGGQWVRAGGALEGYSKQASLRDDGVIVTSNVDDAVRALTEDRHVELTQVREVATLLDKLAALAHAAEELGGKAPVYDLCKVTVKGTNLFCADAFDLTREQMPQFIGFPEPGSPSDALPRRPSGKVDVAPEFLNYLKSHDYTVTETLESASYLRASQRQLNGAKVGQMMEWLRSSSGPYEASPPLVVSEDNYIIDGHHRWAALVGLDAEDGSLGDLKLPVHRVNIKVVSLLMTAKQFTKHMGVRSESVHTKMRKSWLTLVKEAVWNEALHPRHPAGAPASRGGEFARTDEQFSVNVTDTEYRTGRPSRRKVDVIHRPTYAGLKRFGSREIRWIKVPSNGSYFVWDSYEVVHEKMLNALAVDRRLTIDDEMELRHHLYSGPYAGVDSLEEFAKRAYLSKSWLQIIKDAVGWDESKVTRGKTTPESNSGSFAPHPGQGDMFPATKEDFEAEVARGQAILDADRARAAAEAPPPSEMVALYHGTADDVLPMILKEGLRPGSETGVRRWSEDVYYTDQVRKGSVFVVDDVTKAIKWAKEAARKAADADWEDSNPYGDVELVILKVELPRAVYAQMKDDTMLFDGHLMHQGTINPEWIRGYVKGGADDDHIDLLSRASVDIELMSKVFVRRADALVALEKSDTVTVYVPLVFFSPKLKKSWLDRLLKWSEEEHPRGETVEGTNKGSFRPRNMGFVSPNVDENVDFQEAASRVQSHRTKLLLEADEAISEYYGTQTHESVGVGAWADGAEQSIIVDGPGDFEAFKAHMAMSGLLAEQKAIIAFTNDAKGPDSVYRLSVGNRPLKEVHSALLEAGVQFHTLRKTDHNVDVFVFAPGTEQETQNAIAKAAEHFGVDEVDFVKGYGEFLGSWDSREEGRAAYEAVLDAYESKVPRRDGGWKEFCAPWRRRFETVRKATEGEVDADPATGASAVHLRPRNWLADVASGVWKSSGWRPDRDRESFGLPEDQHYGWRGQEGVPDSPDNLGVHDRRMANSGGPQESGQDRQPLAELTGGHHVGEHAEPRHEGVFVSQAHRKVSSAPVRAGAETLAGALRHSGGGQGSLHEGESALSTSRGGWLEEVIKYSPDQPRGKTTPESNSGSFMRLGDGSYEQNKDEFVGEYPGGKGWDSPEVQAWRGREKAWERSMLMALTEGRITQDEARARGFFPSGGGDYTALPETLYHVTVAADRIAAEGLRTREEHGQTGIGGGTDDTISLTSDRALAEGYHTSMIDAHRFITGKTSVEDLLNEAREGAGAVRPWYSDLEETYRRESSDSIDGIPIRLYDAIHGTETWAIPEDLRGDVPRLRKIMEFWGAKGEGIEPIRDGAYMQRTLDPKQALDRKAEFINRWLFWRENTGGGPHNPTFFTNNWAKFAAMSEDNLRLLEIAPRPGAQGYYMPGESEYRVHSGAVLPVRRLLKFDEWNARVRDPSWLGVVKDWDESKHPRGKTTPESTPGSFAPAATQIPDDIAQVLRGWTQNDQQWEWSNLQHAAQYALSGKPPKDYVLYDYRGNDQTLLATAQRTMDYLNSAPSPGRPLYRGLHGNFLPGHRKGAPAYLDEPVREFKVGDEFSESLTSWTGKKALAKEFADDAYSDKAFRSPRKGTVLVLDPEGARAAPVSQLADVGRKTLREADEWMASGRYRVHEITEGRDGTRFVHVRRVGAASHANIAKDWDESKHPRGKTTPESNSGSFSHADDGVKDIDLSDPKPAKEFYVWRVGNPEDGLVGRNAGTLAGVLEYLDQADDELVGTAPTAVKFKVTLNTDMAWGGYEHRSGDFESPSEKAARKRGIAMSPRIGRNNRGWLSFPRTGFTATPVEVISTQDLHRQVRKSWLEKVHATVADRPDR